MGRTDGVVAAAAAAAAVTVTVAAATTTAAAAAPLCDGYAGGGAGGREDMSHVQSRPVEPRTSDDSDASNRIESCRQVLGQVRVQVQARAQAQAQVPVAMWNPMEGRDGALEDDDVKERRRRQY